MALMTKVSLIVTVTLHVTRGEDLCWSRFGNYQYKVLAPDGGAPFLGAVEYCTNINTTLASIHSKEEETFLESFGMSQMSVPLWIGFRRDKAGEYSWADGTQVDYIDPSYRKRDARDGCVYIFMGWNEESCTAANLHFICKRQDRHLTGTTHPATLSSEAGPTNHTSKHSLFSNGANGIVSVNNAGACPTSTLSTESPTERMTSSTDAKTTEQTNIKTATADSQVGSKTTTTGRQTSSTGSIKTTPDSDTRSSTLLNKSTRPTTTFTTTTETTSQSDHVTSSQQTYAATSSSSSEADTVEITTELKQTFEEMLDEMTVKKKPVYQIVEGANSTAIGSVSILILVGILVGVVLLDLSTIRRHVRLIKQNTKDICSRQNKVGVIYVNPCKVDGNVCNNNGKQFGSSSDTMFTG